MRKISVKSVKKKKKPVPRNGGSLAVIRQVVMEYGDDGWWTVRCPSLPGCNSQGKTQEEALTNIKEAIELYLEVLAEDGKPIPPENFTTVTTAIAIGN